MAKITCFGEVLWDVFPSHKKIGGAPLNVASRLRSFNQDVSIITAVGKDALGEKIISYLKEHTIHTAGIQIIDNYKTGEVKVTLNDKGSATYNIEYPSAWDKIEFTDKTKMLVENADAFVFGSLITRDNTSRETLYKLIDIAKYNIFDVNLRPPHYAENILFYLMEKTHFIKFNDDELYEIAKLMGSKFNSLEQNITFISEKTNTKHICVTKGSHGAVLLYNNQLFYNSGYLIHVVDSVGAGDSFLAALISQLINHETPQKAINFACAVGALVAQSEGANPEIPLSEIDAFMNPG
jgi:fructokinase